MFPHWAPIAALLGCLSQGRTEGGTAGGRELLVHEDPFPGQCLRGFSGWSFAMLQNGLPSRQRAESTPTASESALGHLGAQGEGETQDYSCPAGTA